MINFLVYLFGAVGMYKAITLGYFLHSLVADTPMFILAVLLWPVTFMLVFSGSFVYYIAVIFSHIWDFILGGF